MIGFSSTLVLSVVTSDAIPFSTTEALVDAKTEEHGHDTVYKSLMT